MSCCSPRGYDDFFTDRIAARDERRYRKHGLDPVARRVVDVALADDLDGATVLEVGGGIGALQLELLKAGAARATNVELSPAYEAYALSLARDAGLEDRVDRRLFDFAERPDVVPEADLVVLHKVVCCYPDYRGLVTAAASRARRALFLTFPRDAWWNRVGFRAVNVLQRLRRQEFRVYVHDPGAVVGAAEDEGLRRMRGAAGAVWLFTALERGSAGP